MRRESACWCLVTLIVIGALLLAPPAPALADGGPILTEPQLWAQLAEGEQIAVVKLGGDQTAQVDLFISLQDKSGESHQIVFFVPLGVEAANFRVVEETSSSFEGTLTSQLDEALKTGADRKASLKGNVHYSLLAGSLLINGGWSWPLWLVLFLLSGCAPPQAPIATFETPSSQVAIYGLEEDTDLQALISTTGLNPALQQTLSRLKGQQIAIINLQTQPLPAGGGRGGTATGQPGLHLAWTTTLVSHSASASYAYPLGTGAAWAQPIEVTRLYVTAPPGVDFAVQYPKLGQELSGYSGGVPRILRETAQPAYAVENAVGGSVLPYGRLWRATYVQSNSAEDVVITRLPGLSAETQGELRLLERLQQLRLFSWVISLLAALLVWLVIWRYAMPRLLGVQYRWRDLRFWHDALRWSVAYPLAIIVVCGAPVAAMLWIFPNLWQQGVVLIVGLVVLLAAGFVLLVTSLGVPSLILFAREQSRRIGISRGQAGRAYVLVVLLANVAYLLLATVYMALVGVL
jgi:hypothetical protein